jgi:hypothetical protein
VRILGAKQEIPEHIDRQAKKAGLGNSDFYVGPVVDKRVDRTEASIPSHPDEGLEKRMREREAAAISVRAASGEGVSLMQHLRQGVRRVRLTFGPARAKTP